MMVSAICQVKETLSWWFVAKFQAFKVFKVEGPGELRPYWVQDCKNRWKEELHITLK